MDNKDFREAWQAQLALAMLRGETDSRIIKHYSDQATKRLNALGYCGSLDHALDWLDAYVDKNTI